MDIKIKKLNNDLDLLKVNIPSAPTVTVMVLFKVGSRFEDIKESGVAHLIEHNIFKGTTNRPNSKQIAYEVESMGGYMNAATSYEFTEYYIRVPSENLVQAVDILSDMVLNSKFDEEELAKEKTVVIEEIKMYEDNPQKAVFELLYEHLWPNQALGRRITGSIESVNDLGRESIIDFMNKHYHTANALFVVCGDLKDVNIEQILEEKLNLKRDSNVSNFDKATRNDVLSNVIVKQVEQSHLCLSTYGLDSVSDDLYTLRVANTVLGMGFGSYLYQDIREKLGAAYYVYSLIDNYADTGIFSMQAGLDNNRVNEGIDMMIKAFNKLKTLPVNEEELKRAKEVYKGYLSMELESSEEVGRWLAHQYIERGKIDTIEQVKIEIDKVTSDDILRVLSNEVFNKLHLVMITADQPNEHVFEAINN